MGRPGITSEQVHEAADALVSEGMSPTVVSIRTRLGGGSPNNISKWLSQWREARTELDRSASPPMPTSVETAMRGVWVAAWKAAQEQLDGEREAMASARKEIERERAEMLAEINRLDGELEAAKTEIQQVHETLDAERSAHEGTRAEVKEARAVASERKARIEQQTIELQEAQRQAAEVTAQAGRAQALAIERDRALEALEDERTARTEGERKLADLRVEVATLTERAARTDELLALVETLQRGQPQGRS